MDKKLTSKSLEIKTRAVLDVEGINTSADDMTPEEYNNYCNKKWVAVDDLKPMLEWMVDQLGKGMIPKEYLKQLEVIEG